MITGHQKQKLNKALSYIVLPIFAALIIFASARHSQAHAYQQPGSPKASPTPVAPKAGELPAFELLTKEDVDAGLPILTELDRLESEKAVGLNKIYNAKTDEAIIAGARQWREAVKDQSVKVKERDAWIEVMRKAKNCAACLLDLNEQGRPKLVRPVTSAK